VWEGDIVVHYPWGVRITAKVSEELFHPGDLPNNRGKGEEKKSLARTPQTRMLGASWEACREDRRPMTTGRRKCMSLGPQGKRLEEVSAKKLCNWILRPEQLLRKVPEQKSHRQDERGGGAICVQERLQSLTCRPARWRFHLPARNPSGLK